jgi:hypothetical protein
MDSLTHSFWEEKVSEDKGMIHRCLGFFHASDVRDDQPPRLIQCLIIQNLLPIHFVLFSDFDPSLLLHAVRDSDSAKSF